MIAIELPKYIILFTCFPLNFSNCLHEVDSKKQNQGCRLQDGQGARDRSAGDLVPWINLWMLDLEPPQDRATLRDLHRPPPSCCLMFSLFRKADQYSCSTASQSSTWKLVIKQLNVEMTILRAQHLHAAAASFWHMQHLTECQNLNTTL